MKIPDKYKKRKHPIKITVPSRYKGKYKKLNNHIEHQTTLMGKKILAEKKKVRKYKTQELLDILRAEAEKLGESPTVSHFNEDSTLPSTFPYFSRFGSWQKALIAAGLNSKSHRRGKRYTEEHLIRILKLEAKRLGCTPGANYIKNSANLPSISCYITRWGTWNKALLAAGLELNAICNRKEKGEKKDTYAKLLEKPQHRININKLRIEEREQLMWIHFGGFKKIFYLDGDEDKAIKEFVKINGERLGRMKNCKSRNSSKAPKDVVKKVKEIIRNFPNKNNLNQQKKVILVDPNKYAIVKNEIGFSLIGDNKDQIKTYNSKYFKAVTKDINNELMKCRFCQKEYPVNVFEDDICPSCMVIFR